MGRKKILPLQEPEKIDPNRPYTYEDWKRDLIALTKRMIGHSDFKIVEIEAKKCFESGMSTWQVFREYCTFL